MEPNLPGSGTTGTARSAAATPANQHATGNAEAIQAKGAGTTQDIGTNTTGTPANMAGRGKGQSNTNQS